MREERKEKEKEKKGEGEGEGVGMGVGMGEKEGGGRDVLRESHGDVLGCKICFEEAIGVAVLPCGHAFMCVKCAERLALRECSICRRPVVQVVKIYLV